MGQLGKFEDKISTKGLLICILISMWVLGLMIFYRLSQPIDVYYAGIGSMPVDVINLPLKSDPDSGVMAVELMNSNPVDVEVTNGELDVEVTNGWLNPVAVRPQ